MESTVHDVKTMREKLEGQGFSVDNGRLIGPREVLEQIKDHPDLHGLKVEYTDEDNQQQRIQPMQRSPMNSQLARMLGAALMSATATPRKIVPKEKARRTKEMNEALSQAAAEKRLEKNAKRRLNALKARYGDKAHDVEAAKLVAH